MPRNLLKKIKKYLPEEAYNFIKKASGVAQRLGLRLYLVGGVVRDLILGRTNLDLDFCTEGDASMLAHCLEEETGVRVALYPRFGTAHMKIGEMEIDIATARQEVYARPGALPLVKPATLIEDLYRRDFTINALALDLSAASFGNLIDPFAGERDIKKGLIRVLHEKSFIDDATRIFRAIRYEQRLGFPIETNTLKWALRDKGYINSLSGDRIRREIDLIFREELPEKSLARAEEMGIWAILNPELKSSENLKASFERNRQLNQKRPYPLSLMYGIFFSPLKKDIIETLIKRLNTTRDITAVLRDVMKLKAIQTEIVKESGDNVSLYYLLKTFALQAALALAMSCSDEKLRKSLLYYYEKLRYTKTILKGNDLILLGFSPGPPLGEMLKKLLDARLQGQIKSKREELEFLKKYL